MKKLMALLLAVGMTASIAGAQEVLSRNAVGYVKTTIERGDVDLLSLNFNPLGETDYYTVDDLFGDQLPSGSAVFVWDADSQEYVVENRFPGPAGWQPNTAELRPGMSFFVRVGASAPEEEYEVVMMGEVLDEESVTLSGATGLTALSVPFPVSMMFVETDLAEILPVGSALFYWDAAMQEYQTINKFPGVGWIPDDFVVEPGKGFFVRNSGAGFSWVEDKPYDWP